MTHILVIYGSTDGQTEKVARQLGIDLRCLGANPLVVRANRDAPGPEDFDGVVVAASIHAGRFQRDVARWIRRHRPALQAKPSAFLSICLMVRDTREAARQRLAGIIAAFVASCGWEPTVTKPVAGALAYTRYNWVKRWMMRRIAARTGGDTDTTRDHEYTNWADLARFAEDFHNCATVAARPKLKASA